MLSFILEIGSRNQAEPLKSYNRTLRHQNCSTTDPTIGFDFKVLTVTGGPFSFYTVQLFMYLNYKTCKI